MSPEDLLILASSSLFSVLLSSRAPGVSRRCLTVTQSDLFKINYFVFVLLNYFLVAIKGLIRLISPPDPVDLVEVVDVHELGADALEEGRGRYNRGRMLILKYIFVLFIIYLLFLNIYIWCTWQ